MRWALLAFFVSTSANHAVNSPPPPLPPLESVLQLIGTNAVREADNDHAFASKYHFVRLRTEIEKNAKGEEKSRETKASTNNPARHAGKAGGRRLEKDGEPAGRERNRGRGKKELGFDPEVLARFHFEVVAREEREGRPTLLLEFSPRTDVAAKDLTEKFLRQVAGKLWVDEQDGFVVKLDVRLLGPVEVAGGIVGVVKSFACQFERERTPEGLWYTKALNWNIASRQVLSRKITEFVEVRTNVVRAP